MEQDMLNEKPGRHGWKNKLDDPADLPGFVLQDKNTTWEKLHSRLKEKPRRIGHAWYWAAAACILFVCVIPLFTATDQQVATVKDNNVQNVLAETETQPSLPVKVETIVPVEFPRHQIVVNRLPLQPAAEKNARQVNPTNKKQTMLPPVEEKFVAAAEIEMNPIENNSTETVVAIPKPVKQKLKVVHINELGELAPQRNAEKGTDYSFIQIRLITQQVNTGARPTSKGISFNISKPKTTSTN